jgi:predicted RNase H-like nuclease
MPSTKKKRKKKKNPEVFPRWCCVVFSRLSRINFVKINSAAVKAFKIVFPHYTIRHYVTILRSFSRFTTSVNVSFFLSYEGPQNIHLNDS